MFNLARFFTFQGIHIDVLITKGKMSFRPFGACAFLFNFRGASPPRYILTAFQA